MPLQSLLWIIQISAKTKFADFLQSSHGKSVIKAMISCCLIHHETTTYISRNKNMGQKKKQKKNKKKKNEKQMRSNMTQEFGAWYLFSRLPLQYVQLLLDLLRFHFPRVRACRLSYHRPPQ